MENLLKSFPVVIEVPVAWGDMDSYQHVNNTVYIRYFESVRIAYFDRLGLMKFKEKNGVGAILASIQCMFRAPVTYPDTVSAGARISKIEKDRFLMEYCVVSHQLNRVAAEGDGLVISYDYNANRKTSLPDEIKNRITEIENSVF
ncbi:acyl-CoA thioesterase [Thermodesulfobacteriota bacterium]